MTSSINSIIEFAFVTLNFVVFLFNYKILGKRSMHPAVLFSFIWFAVLFLHFIAKLTFLNQLFDVSIYTFSILLLGNISFSFGSILITILKEKRESLEQAPYTPPKWLAEVHISIRLVYFAIVAIGLPYFIYQNYQIFLSSNIDSFFAGLRTELTYGDVSLGPEAYLTSFSYFNLAVQQYSYYRDRKLLSKIIFIASIIFALSYAIFTTGRGPILWVLIILLTMNFLHGRRFSFKTILLAVSGFLIIFSIIGVYYGKGGNPDNTFKENLSTSIETTGSYVVASINALDLKIKNDPEPTYTGEKSLRFFRAVGSSLGLLNFAEVPDLVQEFEFVPYSTNVYTIYSPYISDFGIYYALFMVGLFGVIHTILYNKALQTKNLRYSLFYSLTLYPLFMSFFQDMYLSLFSTWIQITFYTESLIILNRLCQKSND